MDFGVSPEPMETASFILPSPLLTGNPISGFRAVVKRTEDLVCAILLLLLISWFLVGIAIAIKLTSKGPVLFRQPRRGLHTQPFGCFKFRTMYHACADYDATEQTSLNDPRITRLGAFLRRHSLDELPQLFNVIAGDMSLVGPRPHALGTNVDGRLLADMYSDYLRRYQVRPGITGWAQVNGWRGIIDTDEKLQKRVEHDLFYITHWSLWFDIKILFRTFACLFDDKQAH